MICSYERGKRINLYEDTSNRYNSLLNKQETTIVNPIYDLSIKYSRVIQTKHISSSE